MKFEGLKEKIEQYEVIIIHRHVHPDPDALGSQGGLYEVLKNEYPKKRILKGGENNERLSFLSVMDTVREEDYKDALVIITDTANEPRIDGNAEWLKQASEWVKIDHHPGRDSYAPTEYVYTSASSTCELIFEFVEEAGYSLTNEAARLLYGGIVGDTGRFLFNNTTPHTLEVASQLIGYDFDAALLSRTFMEMGTDATHFAGYIQQNFEVNEAGVGSIIITNQLLERFNVKHNETDSMIGLIGQVSEVKAWILFVEKEDGTGYRCHLRSKTEPISQVAVNHGGGGHPLASGCDADDQKEIEEMLQEMTEILEASEA